MREKPHLKATPLCRALHGHPARAALAQGIYLLDKDGRDEEIPQSLKDSW